MTNVFFTSDTHYGHANIIKYCSRPYADVHEMDEALIANHNGVVGPKDVVYHLGDFGFAKMDYIERILGRLNGRIRLIQGNHDGWMSDVHKKGGVEAHHKFGKLRNVEWIKRYHEIEGPAKMAGGRRVKICLFHYAIGSWHCAHRGAWMLHGHSHGQYKHSWPMTTKSKIADVGVDSWDYRPVSMDQIKELMESLDTENPDDFTVNGNWKDPSIYENDG